MEGISVFSGTAHRGLSEEVCRYLNETLSPSSYRKFSNDCQFVQLGANCRERDVFIIQPIVPPTQEHLMELMFMLDAARGASARRLTAVIPHYAYARSDKKDTPRISIAARLVADLLVTAGADRVLTMTLHSEQVHGFFSVPVDHLNALPILAQHFSGRENAVVVSPDLGNAKSASHFARMLKLPVAAGSKQRLSDDKVIIDTIVGDVEGRHAIILDDEIATGGSVIELIERLKDRGAISCSVACTHGLFTGNAVQRLVEVDGLEEIVSTNTVPIPDEKLHPKLKVLSIASLFAEAIKRIHMGESVSSLFRGTF
jgi:ribose-phosphate pyrophosphokinase